jgi:hypothetical protein
VTALNGFKSDRAAHLFTDAAVVNPETFSVIGFMNKAVLLPQCQAALSTTGDAAFPMVLGTLIAQAGLNSFDSLVTVTPAIIRNAGKPL